LQETFTSRINALNIAEDQIIIASMLEREVQSDEDMRLVAGIMYKRMEIGMPLQIDATVAYGACLRQAEENNFGKNCDTSFIGVAREIPIDSKYNTYTRKGLPDGPISNPGLRAIDAAKNPKESPYLYYLSTRDGETIFSRTGAEHEANRRKYLGL